MQSLQFLFKTTINYAKKHKIYIGSLMLLGIFCTVLLLLIGYLIINHHARYILPASNTESIRVGIVLGAGITKDGRPFKELQSRLDAAAAAYHERKVETLVLSGDNRFAGYNEPEAMRRYLLKRGVPASRLQPDYAGRSTYESCERAAKVFQLKKVVIFSAPSHLPRAIYLCRHFGVEAYGRASRIEANNATRRELLARVKALYNVYIRGERTVLGETVKL
ncbi:MAG TPA: ElyC/SanA/YdcF family protein [Candidatus Limnocylindrales bacterium]|nr:ElyC/SanA/YdcF family protein [Candidatus Limnocylindrales bacterium]